MSHTSHGRDVMRLIYKEGLYFKKKMNYDNVGNGQEMGTDSS